MKQILQGQEGLVLVTGPTGSGKSTTVYSMLESFGKQNSNIVSIEDPVEFAVPFVRQMSVDEKHCVTMTSGLRTLLRMDPDVIFIGEIRDTEAAAIALRAANSGAFVFSSLHARDVASSIALLRDFGATPKAVSSGLAGIINQRLVRRLCLNCRRVLPKDFRESLLLHNGGDCWILWYGELLTLNSILDQWNMYREMQSRGEYAVLSDDGWSANSIDGPIKPVFWNPKRICVTDNSGDHLILDLDPPDDGQRGQIIDHSHEVGPQTILASSWGDFLQKLADDLEAGEYVYVEEEEMVALPGMYD